MRPSRHHVPSPSHRMGRPAPAPRRAVVLGGSLAGLLTANALSEHVDEVVVVDRDRLDTELEAPRRGVPQGRHTHGLLVGGARAIESIVPGFTDALIARGALQADAHVRSRWLFGDNLLVNAPLGLEGLLASRTLIESEVRRRVVGRPGIRVMSGVDVVGLIASPDGRRVVGARVARRPDADGADAVSDAVVELPADLVVDATGRASRAPQWLADLGLAVPEETTVPAEVRYVTRLFRDRRGVLDDIDAEVIGTRPTDGRGGVALRQEGGRWTVTIAGQFGSEPSADLEGFRAFARTLPSKGIAAIAEECEPVGDAERFTYRQSRWRHWERIDRRPAGFLAVGDAFCSFNPVYGQGMSSTAQQVEVLADLLREHGFAGVEHRAPEAFARVVSSPWALSTGSDRRFPGQPAKPLPERWIDRYLDRLLEVATEDAGVATSFARVLNLLAEPSSLLRPSIALRVVGPSSRAMVSRARAARKVRLAPAVPVAQAASDAPASAVVARPQ